MAEKPKTPPVNLVKRDEKQPINHPGAIIPQSNVASQLMQRELSEIQSAMTLAKMYPRNMVLCKEKVEEIFSDTDFADQAIYAKPQGWKDQAKTERNYVEGLSIDAALELKNICGNILLGGTIIDESEDRRILEIYAWDVETNNRVSEQITVPKSIERKFVNSGDIKIGERANSKGEVLHIIRPSEDELRLSQSRHVSFAQRNCILKIIPSPIKLSAERIANEALVANAKNNMEKAKDPAPDKPEKKTVDPRAGILAAFKKMNVTREQIEAYMQAKIEDWTPEMVADLKKIGKQLKDSGDPIKAAAEVFVVQDAKAEPPKAKATASTSENRGHGNNDLGSVTEPEEDKETLFGEEKEDTPSGSEAWE